MRTTQNISRGNQYFFSVHREILDDFNIVVVIIRFILNLIDYCIDIIVTL